MNIGWDTNSLSARMLHLFLPTSSHLACSLSGIGRFDKSLPCPHEDGQEQRLSLASIKFLWLTVADLGEGPGWPGPSPYFG